MPACSVVDQMKTRWRVWVRLGVSIRIRAHAKDRVRVRGEGQGRWMAR